MSQISYKQALDFYQSHQYDRAINIFTKLLERNLGSKKESDVYTKLAGAYYKSSQYNKAIYCYEKLISDYKPCFNKEGLYNLYFWNAKSADKVGKTYKAIKHYSLSLKEGHPDKENILIKIADLNHKDFFEAGRLDSAKYAVIYYNKAIESKHPSTGKIHFKLGDIYTNLYKKGEEKHFKNAEAEYLASLKHPNSNHAIIHQKLGYLYVKNGMLEQAKIHCHESMRLGNKSYKITIIYGKFKLKSSLYEDAIKYFNYALKAVDCTDEAKIYISNLISSAEKHIEEDVYPRDPGAPPPAETDSRNASSESSDDSFSGSRKRSLEEMLGYHPSDFPRKDLSEEYTGEMYFNRLAAGDHMDPELEAMGDILY